MDIAVTGSSGLIGTALLAALRAAGHRAIPVVRPESQAAGESLDWDPNGAKIDATGFEGLDAVVHLAGTGIGDKRWTPAQKQRIVESRVRPTTLLCETLAGLTNPPGVLVSGSAIGWYGDRGSEVLTESSGPPTPLDFLAGACRPVGIGNHASRGGRHPNRASPHWHRPRASGWRAPADGVAVQARLGRTHRVRQAIHELDRVGRRDRRNRPLDHCAGALGPGQRDGPDAGDELRVHLGARSRPQAPDPAADSGAGAEARLRLGAGGPLLVGGQRVVPDRLQATGYEFLQPDLEDALQANL